MKNKKINLAEIAEDLKDKELFPESNKHAKETVQAILNNPDNAEVLKQMGLTTETNTNSEAIEFVGKLIANKLAYSQEYKNEMFR